LVNSRAQQPSLYSHATLDLHIASGNWRQASRLKMACVHIYFIFTSRIAAAVTLKCRRAHHKKKAKGASLVASLQRRKIFFAHNMNGG